MAEYTCHNCVYAVCDPCRWLRLVWAGESIWPQCGNHPQWPGRMHDVPGVPCRNYRPRPEPPEGENVRCIPLDDGGYVYVDAADYEWLRQWPWHLSGGYAARSEKGRLILMHRQIMNPPKGMIVDHKNGHKANNCRFNLRVCTRDQNRYNKRKQTRSVSKYKGVYLDRRTGKWGAHCRYKGRNYGLGGFGDDEVAAARAYDRRAVEWFGEFARVNFPREWPPERRAEVYAQRRLPSKAKAKSKSKKPVAGRTAHPARRDNKPVAARTTRPARRKAKKPPRAAGHKPRATKTKPHAKTQGRRAPKRTANKARTRPRR
ncbi:MAG: HNH endonuclease [Sedimentisphaerales bacterium]|nr:HNH endonuclease [Sedimentisphaerales bacterium]